MDDPIERLLTTRLDGHGRRILDLDAELERVKTSVAAGAATNAALTERLNSIDKGQNDLADGMKSLRTLLITFALSVAGSAIAVLLGLTQVVTK